MMPALILVLFLYPDAKRVQHAMEPDEGAPRTAIIDSTRDRLSTCGVMIYRMHVVGLTYAK